MKKIIALALSLMILLSTICVNAAQIYYDDEWHTYNGNIFTLTVDGKKINCEVPPIVFDDYSVVPARDVFESMGAKVSWEASSQLVTVKYDKVKIELNINNTTVKVNGIKRTAPIPPKLINGKTMIPVRFVAETLGFKVDFDSKTDTIIINTKKETEVKPKPEVTNPAGPGKDEEKPTYDITLRTYSYAENDGVFTATFTFTESVKYSQFVLKEPTRLVIDTENTKFPTSLKSVQTDYDDVTGIRLGQQTNGVRCVFDLARELDYSISTLGSKLIVKIGEGVKDEPLPEDPDDEGAGEEEEEIVPVIPDPPSYKPTRTVYLDPGHGGTDPGAIFTDEEGTTLCQEQIQEMHQTL